MAIDEIDVIGQILNFSSSYFTHEVKINISDKHLTVKVNKGYVCLSHKDNYPIFRLHK